MKQLTLIVLLVFSAYTGAQSVPSMSELKIQLAPNQTLPLGETIQFEIKVHKVETTLAYLALYNNIKAAQSGDKLITITMSQTPRYQGEIEDKFTRESFVIDINEDSTQSFINGFLSSDNAAPNLEAIARYVDSYIEEPTYINSFGFASTVARQKSGDCTEYAVLTTALARALGLPARLQIGTAIVVDDNSASAYGHAWTEVWYEDKWHVMDAALYRSPAPYHFYLPAGALNNEGPGYTMSMAMAVSSMPSYISGLRAVDK